MYNTVIVMTEVYKCISSKAVGKPQETGRTGKGGCNLRRRRTGKTTLLKEFLNKERREYLLVNGEDITVHSHLSSQSVRKAYSVRG